MWYARKRPDSALNAGGLPAFDEWMNTLTQKSELQAEKSRAGATKSGRRLESTLEGFSSRQQAR